MREQLADEARVLDLLERSGHPEQRFVLLAEVRADLVGAGEVVATESLEACPMRRVHELLVEPELHQRVAPVEENRRAASR